MLHARREICEILCIPEHFWGIVEFGACVRNVEVM
jgi:hypothetical protein